MKYSEAYFEEAGTVPIYIYDKTEQLFFDELRKYFGKERVSKINNFQLLERRLGWEYDYSFEGYEYFYMKPDIAENVSDELYNVGLDEHHDNICSIIQEHFYMSILASIAEKENEPRRNFVNEFVSLYEFLKNDITEIKLATNKTSNTLKIKNKLLINHILITYLESGILNSKTPFNIVNDYTNTKDKYDYAVHNKIVDSAAINLLLYLQFQTNYKFNSLPENVQVGKFTNKQFELIYNLLNVSTLINFDKIESQPKDYIGNKIRRNIHLSQYFNGTVVKKKIRAMSIEDFDVKNTEPIIHKLKENLIKQIETLSKEL